MTISRAQRLLADAADEDDRVSRHLLVAAAMREVLAQEPIVVGGTAEDFYTADVYVETDLDLCGWVTAEEEKDLHDLGFERDGRHWVHRASSIAVEFPENRIEGDESRIIHKRIGSGEAAIIGVDDLYLDRVRQATAYDDGMEDSTDFRAAVAVGVAAYEEIDWRYVERQIDSTEASSPPLGSRMRIVHRRARRRILSALNRA